MYWTLLYLLCGVVLLVASIQDIKYKQVENKVWLLSYPVALIGGLLIFGLNPFYLLNIGLALFMGVALFFANCWNGADVKALVLIGLCSPFFMQPILALIFAFVILFLGKKKGEKIRNILRTPGMFIPFLFVGFFFSPVSLILTIYP